MGDLHQATLSSRPGTEEAVVSETTKARTRRERQYTTVLTGEKFSYWNGLQLLAIHPDRDRAVIDEFNFHIRAKNAVCNC